MLTLLLNETFPRGHPTMAPFSATLSMQRSLGRSISATTAPISVSRTAITTKSVAARAATASVTYSRQSGKKATGTMLPASGSDAEQVNKGIVSFTFVYGGSLPRQGSKWLAAVEGASSASLPRSTGKKLTATSAPDAATFSRSFVRAIAATMAVFSSILPRSFVRAIVSTAASFQAQKVSQTQKSLAAQSQRAASTLGRTISHLQSAITGLCSAVLAQQKVLLRSLNATFGQWSATVTSNSARRWSLSGTTAPATAVFNRSTSRQVPATTAPDSGLTSRQTGRSVTAAQAPFSASISSLKALLVSIAARAATFVGIIPRQTSHALPAVTNTVPATLGRVSAKSLSAIEVMQAALGRSWSYRLTASLPGFAGSTSSIRAILRSVTAVFAPFTATVAKNSARNVTATMASAAASLGRGIPKVISAVLSVLSGSILSVGAISVAFTAVSQVCRAVLTRQTSRTTSATEAPFSGSLPRRLSRVFTAISASPSAATLRGRMIALNASLQSMAAAFTGLGLLARTFTASLRAFDATNTRQIAKSESASLPLLSPKLARQSTRSFTASLPLLTGAVVSIKAVLVAMAANLALFAPSLTRRVSRSYAPVLSLSVSLERSIGLVLTAAGYPFAGLAETAHAVVRSIDASLSLFTAVWRRDSTKGLSSVAASQVAALPRLVAKPVSSSLPGSRGGLGRGRALLVTATLNIWKALATAFHIQVERRVRVFSVYPRRRSWTVEPRISSWIVQPKRRLWKVTDHFVPIPATKDPQAIEDFKLDWAAYVGNDSIQTATWETDATDLTISLVSNTTTTTTARLAGGSLNYTYDIYVKVTRGSGQLSVLRIILNIEEI